MVKARGDSSSWDISVPTDNGFIEIGSVLCAKLALTHCQGVT